VARITLPNGKRRAKYAKTQKEAKDWLMAQRQAVSEGMWVESEKATLGEYLDRWMADVVTHKLRPKTVQSYAYLIRLHIKPELGHIKLTSLRPDQVQALYARKMQAGLSGRTVQYIHAVLHRSLEQAVKWGLLARNVTDAVDKPSPTKRLPKFLTAAQVKQLLVQLKDDRLFALYVLAIAIGARVGELLGLAYANWTGEVLTIRQAVQFLPHQGLVITTPKTDASNRAVHLPAMAIAALQFHREKYPGEGLIFATANGTPISPRNLLRHWHAACKKLGWEVMPFHTLRHSCASLHLLAGTSPKAVQQLLGHSSVNLTMNIYSHLLPGVEKEAAERMNGILTG